MATGAGSGRCSGDRDRGGNGHCVGGGCGTGAIVDNIGDEIVHRIVYKSGDRIGDRIVYKSGDGIVYKNGDRIVYRIGYRIVAN